MSSPTSHHTGSTEPTTAPSSPPPAEPLDQGENNDEDIYEEKDVLEEEKRARAANEREKIQRQKKLAAKRKLEREDSKESRDAKARQLDELLAKSAVFSEILTKKTEVLGRVGSGFDGQALGEHDLTMAKQPKCMIGGTMRDYQLEGLTWMLEICVQGMSGILADEMGLGKTIQTISLIASLREDHEHMGPHLIIAPLSTLSNWIEEFAKWVPDVPVVKYHGTPAARAEIRKNQIFKHLVSGKPNRKFPVVCTSYEMILRDKTHLSKIGWEFIIIDEGHRMKSSESSLFRELRLFRSQTRLLITGTPLQNNLKELWSLLNFLLPDIFTNWEMFESWFDFSDLQDEEGTEEFIADQQKQQLVKKMHLILQPLLLRRIKADVESHLPKKREYVLFAPMTKEQTDLYRVISDKSQDTRKYLEDKVVERLNAAKPVESKNGVDIKKTKEKNTKKEESDSEDDTPLQRLALRGRKSLLNAKAKEEPAPALKNAFSLMKGMGGKKFSVTVPRTNSTGSTSTSTSPAPPTESPSKKRGRPRGSLGAKRKASEAVESPVKSVTPIKSARTSRTSTPAGSVRGRKRKTYKEADATDEDELSDDEFEAKLAEELDVEQEAGDSLNQGDPEEIEKANILELARREISTKKLGNPIMQLRLTCNSPHNFYNPFTTTTPPDSTLITSSGKMLLLDRLLPHLFSHNHKVLIFSQFKTQLDILHDYCLLKSYPICRIDGGVSQTDRREQIKLFNEDKDFKLFLLSTRAGGQGINLAAADTVVLYDSDWNPQMDLQAQDRAHRIGQTRPVIVYRLATKGTVEEQLLLSADAKRRLEKLVIKKGGFRTMGQKQHSRGEGEDEGDEDDEALKSLLLRDGEVYTLGDGGVEGGEVLSDKDLEVLCDRSDEAYAKAEKGLGMGNEKWRNVKTVAGGLMTEMDEREKGGREKGRRESGLDD